jgi:hypothetical protein
MAALLASLLVAVFLAYRRRKVTHARLKIDLDAVRSEAGRIESTDFFKSVKDQVKKEKDDRSANRASHTLRVVDSPILGSNL